MSHVEMQLQCSKQHSYRVFVKILQHLVIVSFQVVVRHPKKNDRIHYIHIHNCRLHCWETHFSSIECAQIEFEMCKYDNDDTNQTVLKKNLNILKKIWKKRNIKREADNIRMSCTNIKSNDDNTEEIILKEQQSQFQRWRVSRARLWHINNSTMLEYQRNEM